MSDNDPVVVLAKRFEAEVDTTLAAAECGVSPDEFLDVLNREPNLARSLGPLRISGGTVKRELFAKTFPELIRTLNRGTPLGLHRRTPLPVVGNADAATARDFGAMSRRPDPGELLTIELDGVAMRFRWCPPGRFKMGSPVSEKGRSEDEDNVAGRGGSPADVRLSGFWMLETEVTQKMWFAIVGTRPWLGKAFTRDGMDYPATFVKHSGSNSATEFCRSVTTIGRQRGKITDNLVCRLPTEAEWEYACRAGKQTSHSLRGGATLSQHAWFYRTTGKNKFAHPVSSKLPNAWGLYDMHGNCWEWTADWYGTQLEGGIDPRGPATGTLRVMRGGAWYANEVETRCGFRFKWNGDEATDSTGFRIVLSEK